MKKSFIIILSVITFVCFGNITPVETKAAGPTSSNTITKKKTTQFKNSSGTVLWSVSITATFTYDGSTSKCTSCTPSAKAYASTWSIRSVTSSKSGNSATATAVARQTDATGNTYDYTKSVTIKCSATGVVS